AKRYGNLLTTILDHCGIGLVGRSSDSSPLGIVRSCVRGEGLMKDVFYYSKFLLLAIGGIVVVFLPFFASELLVGIFIIVFAYAIFAASWDLICGYAGQINLGPNFTFGIAGFASALMEIYLHTASWISLLGGVIVATFAGFVL